MPQKIKQSNDIEGCNNSVLKDLKIVYNKLGKARPFPNPDKRK